ncbi:MAG: hypothetical protein CSA62_08395 [Planctomycetota bacterium]|nr:MAG: hypothetical protein CSA62_08395 [Planctomycetota bacterium]
MDEYRNNAYSLAAALSEKYEQQIDCNAAGVDWVSDFILSRSEELDPETQADLVELIGAFLGEAICAEYGGQWEVQGERGYLRLSEGGLADPFQMATCCLRYRERYPASQLFAVTPALAKLRIGGLYSVAGDDGKYRIYKVLAADHLAVHLRKFAKSYDSVPEHLKLEELEIGINLNAWQKGGEMPAELPIGHFPLAHEGFWELSPQLIQVEPVAEDELMGFHLWLYDDEADEATADEQASIKLRETTVAQLAGFRVGLAKVWQEEYSDAEGVPRQGVRGTLAVMCEDEEQDFDLRVALGDEVKLGSARYIVSAIDEGEQLGTLTLTQLPPEATPPSSGLTPIEPMPEPSGPVRPMPEPSTPAQATEAQASPAQNTQAPSTPAWLTVLALLPFLLLPHATTGVSRAGLGLAALVAWGTLMRPSWRGLSGFYGTALLALQAVVLLILSLF